MINGSYKWSPMNSPGMSKTLHLNSIQLKLYQSGGDKFTEPGGGKKSSPAIKSQVTQKENG